MTFKETKRKIAIIALGCTTAFSLVSCKAAPSLSSFQEAAKSRLSRSNYTDPQYIDNRSEDAGFRRYMDYDATNRFGEVESLTLKCEADSDRSTIEYDLTTSGFKQRTDNVYCDRPYFR